MVLIRWGDGTEMDGQSILKYFSLCIAHQPVPPTLGHPPDKRAGNAGSAGGGGLGEVHGAKLILASAGIKRKRELEKGYRGLLNGSPGFENMRSDGEFVTSCWL